MRTSIEYPHELAARHQGTVVKCKHLRNIISKMGFKDTGASKGSFFRETEGIKYSGLYRKLVMEDISNRLPWPPAYFTRQRDGIMVPRLHEFIQGYRNIKKNMHIFQI